MARAASLEKFSGSKQETCSRRIPLLASCSERRSGAGLDAPPWLRLVHQGPSQGHLALTILAIVDVKPTILTVTSVNCGEGILDNVFALVFLLNFGGMDAARGHKEECLVGKVVDVVEEVAESADKLSVGVRAVSRVRTHMLSFSSSRYMRS